MAGVTEQRTFYISMTSNLSVNNHISLVIAILDKVVQKTQFPHLYNGGDNTYLCILCKLNEVIWENF